MSWPEAVATVGVAFAVAGSFVGFFWMLTRNGKGTNMRVVIDKMVYDSAVLPISVEFNDQERNTLRAVVVGDAGVIFTNPGPQPMTEAEQDDVLATLVRHAAKQKEGGGK